MFEDIDVDEAFCSRKTPGASFDPHKDDPIALVAERVKLIRSDRKKYSMESDYLDSDFFDDIDDDVPHNQDWKNIKFDVDTENIMYDIHTLELQGYYRENLGVIPEFMEDTFADLEQELIDEGLLKRGILDDEEDDDEGDDDDEEDDEEDDAEDNGEHGSENCENDVMKTSVDGEKMVVESVE